MPRKIEARRMTIDALEAEALYTRAALKADPEGADFLELTEGWLPGLDALRAQGREVRSLEAEADAARGVANGRLDAECEGFADQLWLEVGKDRKSPRWTQFFKGAVSKFLRSAFAEQVAVVRGWLAGSADAALERRRPELERWTRAGEEALLKSRALGAKRGEYWQAREEQAEGMTRERDALHDALAERARETGLARDWPDLFFRKETAEERPAPPKDDAS